MSYPEGLERDFPLARLTTVRAGGSGDMFARAGTEEQLLEHLRILEQEPELLAEVVRFLQGRIARRGAAWRFAYELLDGVETRRQRLARHAPLQP